MTYKELQFPKDSLFLVTGGAGFIGSNLCEAILKMGYKVRCLDDLSTGKQKNADMFLGNPNYEFIKGDIKNLDTCMEACKDVDYVLNQAAWEVRLCQQQLCLWRRAQPAQGRRSRRQPPLPLRRHQADR